MIRFFILDTETTGLKVGFHEINQISVLRASERTKIIGQAPQNFFEPLPNEDQLSLNIAVKYPERASYEALNIQGITNANLKTGISGKDAVNKVNEFITSDGLTPEHRCIVGHNVPFDRKFVFRLWEENGLVFPAYLWLCTQSMAKAFVKNSNMKEKIAETQGFDKVKFGLNHFLNGVGLMPKTGAHSAEVDVQNTTTLMNWLIHEGVDYVPMIKRQPQIEEKKPVKNEWEMEYE